MWFTFPVLVGAARWLKERLELPEVRGIDHDSPDLVPIHRRVIAAKPFLKALYERHYRELGQEIRGLPDGTIVELGSGGGFIKEVLPSVLTSDLHPESQIDLTLSAEKIDLADGSVSALLLLNVFHHIANPRAFLKEALRVLKPGGRVVLVEPAHTWLWKRLYGLFSPEPYRESAESWSFPPSGRFSGANVPLAWIVFERDRQIFEREFPEFRIARIRYHTAFLYLLSGGIWFRALAPSWSFPVFYRIEQSLQPFMRAIAGQMTVVLQKR